jgi:hypothetical protein
MLAANRHQNLSGHGGSYSSAGQKEFDDALRSRQHQPNDEVVDGLSDIAPLSSSFVTHPQYPTAARASSMRRSCYGWALGASGNYQREVRAIRGPSPLTCARLKGRTLHNAHAAMLDQQEVSGPSH